MKYLEKNNLNEEIKEGITLVDFYTTWCGPCKMMESVLEELDINVIKVDVEKFEELGKEYAIMSVPTLIFFKDGKEQKKLIGFQTKDALEEIIKEL